MDINDCETLGIPSHLWQTDREIQNDFEENELLYRRHKEIGNLETLQKLSASEIGRELFKLKNDSYVRSSFCMDISDVLYNTSAKSKDDHPVGSGIISIKVANVKDLTIKVELNNISKECKLVPAHTPHICNYPHSEIFLYVDNVLFEGNNPKSANTFFRRELQKLMTVVKETVLSC